MITTNNKIILRASILLTVVKKEKLTVSNRPAKNVVRVMPCSPFSVQEGFAGNAVTTTVTVLELKRGFKNV